MRAMLKEMDKDFNDRERLRLLEQRQYEERAWAEGEGAGDESSPGHGIVAPATGPSDACCTSPNPSPSTNQLGKIINTTSAPAAIGPYSQAVVVDRTMYISGQLGLDVASGQLGLDVASGQLVEGGVQAQAKQALINMGEILKAAVLPLHQCVQDTVLLTNINDLNSINEVYKTFFSSKCPARAAYQVAALPKGGLVEIEAVAVLGPLSDS